LAKALAEKEIVANRTEEEVENEKAARAAQVAQRKRDRDIELADEVDNLVDGRAGSGSGKVRVPSALSFTGNYGQWNERSGD
jgi:mevalonate pyrophosphate decarboxylase